MDTKNPKVYIVGAGPGDPELITLKAQRLLNKADVVVYAGSLINHEILRLCKREALLINSHGKNLQELTEIMAKAARENKIVVRLSSGDPSIYSSLKEFKEELEKRDIGIEVIPGVSAFSAACSSIKEELTVPEGPQSVVITRLPGKTPVPETEDLSRFAATGSSIAVFLSADKVNEIKKKALSGGLSPETKVAVIYKASWPEEEITLTNLENLDKIKAKNPSVVLILPGYERKGKRSHLYSRAFKENKHNHCVSIIQISSTGERIASKLKEMFLSAEIIKGKDIHEKTKKAWKKSNPIIFIGSLGIAVRAISSHLKDKIKDPPVILTDLSGCFVIPVIGGHKGANKLARLISQKLGAVCAITTGTEVTNTVCLEDIIEERNLIFLGGSTLDFNKRAIEKREIFSMGMGFHKDVSADIIKEVIEIGKNLIKDEFSVFSTIDTRKEIAKSVVSLVIPKNSALIAVKKETLLSFPYKSKSRSQDFLNIPAVAEPASLAVLPEGEIVIPKKVHKGVTFAISKWKPR